jgi:hypothetical protein
MRKFGELSEQAILFDIETQTFSTKSDIPNIPEPLGTILFSTLEDVFAKFYYNEIITELEFNMLII